MQRKPVNLQPIIHRDRHTKVRFLIDTGADLCVFPHLKLPKPRVKSNYELPAANGTTIATYGTITLSLDLGLRRQFTRRFVVADVSKSIIVADFLVHYGLLVDIKNHRLLDQATHLTFRGEVVEYESQTIKTITGSSPYHQLLQRLPEITRSNGNLHTSGTTKAKEDEEAGDHL